MTEDVDTVIRKGTCPVCGSACFIKAHLTGGKIMQKAQLLEGMAPSVVHAGGYWWYPAKPEAEPSLFGVWESNIDSILPDAPDVCDHMADSYFRGLLCRVYKAT